MPAVTLGVFILWLGWFGFNGGSQLQLSGAVDAVAISNILVNTNLSAAAGVMTAIGLSRLILGRIDLLAGLNGAIAGLVAITAAPDIVDHYWAIIIGAVGGNIVIQATGVVAIGAFVFISSIVVWIIIDKTLGARISPTIEDLGQDAGELGIEAYPVFVLMPEED